jgi:hypothetical protein
MIIYLVTEQHTYTMGSFLSLWANELAKRINILPYDIIFSDLSDRRFKLKVGTYIFSDIERLTPWQAEILSKIWEAISRYWDEKRLINHPGQSMRRYQLLRTLRERGLNKFNVYRLEERIVPERFPVFIRGENDHFGNLTGLLHTPRELSAAIQELARQGKRIDDKIVVEFINTSDNRDIYRKYSAFIVRDRIVPRHLFFSRNWMVKVADVHDASMLAEELEYVHSNPHETQLREIFRIARIDYGRIDYSILDGSIQVWEINTNPMLASRISADIPERRPVHDLFVDQIKAAFEVIDTAPASTSTQ